MQVSDGVPRCERLPSCSLTARTGSSSWGLRRKLRRAERRGSESAGWAGARGAPVARSTGKWCPEPGALGEAKGAVLSQK